MPVFYREFPRLLFVATETNFKQKTFVISPVIKQLWYAYSHEHACKGERELPDF